MSTTSKKQAKRDRQKTWGMQVSEHIPMVLVREMNDEIASLLGHIADGVPTAGVQVVVVEPEQEGLKDICKDWEKKFPAWFRVLQGKDLDESPFDMELLEEATVERLAQLKERNIVPVAKSGVKSFDAVQETGSGFLFSARDPWSLYVALVRAKETYQFPYDWKNISNH